MDADNSYKLSDKQVLWGLLFLMAALVILGIYVSVFAAILAFILAVPLVRLILARHWRSSNVRGELAALIYVTFASFGSRIKRHPVPSTLLALICLAIIISVITAAPEGGGSRSKPSTLTVYPAHSTVLAGDIMQFTASADDVTWEVDGEAGGNSIVGTVSASGLYTAPEVPPPFGPVTITARAGGVNASATVEVRYTDASVMGQWVFEFEEMDHGAVTAYVGSITLDGNGGVTGIEDVNGPVGILKALPVTGSYSVPADGQGMLTLKGFGVETLALTWSVEDSVLARALGDAVGGLTDNDAGKVGWGTAVPTTPINQLLTFSRQFNYTFSFGPQELIPTRGSIGYLRLTENGTVSSGSMDENDSHIWSQNYALSGHYTFGDDNRGTLTLNSGRQAGHYVFYAVDSEIEPQFEVLRTDPGKIEIGQLGEYEWAQLVNGRRYVFQLFGMGRGRTPDAMLMSGHVYTSGAEMRGTMNLDVIENDDGHIHVTSEEAPYAVTSYNHEDDKIAGRGQMALPTFRGKRSFVFNGLSIATFNMLETTTGFGNVTGLATLVIGNRIASGEYALSMRGGVPGTSSLTTVQAILDVGPSYSVTGQETIGADGDITTIPITGVISSAGKGFYNLILKRRDGHRADYILAPYSNGIAAVIGTDSNEVTTGTLIEE